MPVSLAHTRNVTSTQQLVNTVPLATTFRHRPQVVAAFAALDIIVRMVDTDQAAQQPILVLGLKTPLEKSDVQLVTHAPRVQSPF